MKVVRFLLVTEFTLDTKVLTTVKAETDNSPAGNQTLLNLADSKYK